MKDKLRYHGYSYKEFVQEIADCECVIPHTDLTLPPSDYIWGCLQLYLGLGEILLL